MGSEGMLFSYEENFRNYKVLISASYGGHDINLDPDFQFGKTDKSEQFLKKFPLGRVPALELKDGRTLSESNAAAFYLATEQLRGGQLPEVQAQVLTWMFQVETELTPAVCNWIFPILGILQDTSNQTRGKSDTLKFANYANQVLRKQTWLVGERISLADICTMAVLKLVMDNQLEDFSELKHLKRWYKTVSCQKEIQPVLEKYPGIVKRPADIDCFRYCLMYVDRNIPPLP